MMDQRQHEATSMSTESETPHESQPKARKPLIELGWILYGKLESADIDAARAAQAEMLARMTREFPDFHWRMPLIERPEPMQSNREEPVVLLDYGRTEREFKHWDFALVVTAADLKSHYRPFTIGTPSRSLGVGVLSTFLIDPQAQREMPRKERIETLKARILAAALHVFGHLNGLRHAEEDNNVMFPIEQPEELDRMLELTDEQKDELHAELADVADLRLEERVDSRRLGSLWFYVRAARIGADEIIGTIWQARPWEFPLRLSRLTAAAGSALIVLMITEEVWNLGMSQSVGFVVLFSVVSLIATSLYILKRQQLLLGRGRRRLTEQTAVTNIAVTIVVGLGMLTTYVFLFLICLLVSHTVFSKSLVGNWVNAPGGKVAFGTYLIFAGFIASLGILIGALGASFEGQTYFRHIAYVDKEV